jgi:uncharacterized protein (TIGR02444 family)
MDNPFWQYSLAHYARPGVEPLCLRAQDSCGVEVNFLLYAAWLNQRGQPLEPGHLAALAAATRDWRQQVVSPLRALRRNWRGLAGAEALRRDLKALELRAERALQDAIWDFYQARPPAPGVASLETNLAAVFAGAGVPEGRALELSCALAEALA